MEKKYAVMLAMFLLAIVGFMGCSDDEESGSGDTGIVGTWEYNPNEAYIETVQFRADGTYTKIENEYYSSRDEWIETRLDGNYVFDEGTMELTLNYYYDGDPFTRSCTVLRITSDMLEIMGWSPGYEDRIYVFRRAD